ncbi:MAG: bifunctional homocysteine S-methyltransferase/methylenetetrahydrofolate reductase [Fimbriimonas ginsengisoli]|uniref:Bifunctional homocysteine S-methyltransferase/methylenetetrahydrofolate reductase n=1 Tax=Fimbriimonas ginsengisoli TaxID=1005039 RepID=A0A931LZ69_FIMGI|nr:bifunctional homocysteine S-methyltransferase/methylenetetrahydrofolate reductase [Fimbriimonas ginsengisoli]
MRLIQALESGVLLGDGANGTFLGERGFTQQPYDLANLLAPDLVRQAHEAYFAAGVDLVETNTFAANAIRLAGRDVNVRDLNLAGARLARQAAGVERLVLGAIGPCSRALEPIGQVTVDELKASVLEQAEALAEGGVDGFLLETYIDMEELRLAVEAVRSASDLPIIVSKAYIEEGEMLSEGLPARCAQEMTDLTGVVAVGANCIVGPQRMLDLVRMIAETTDLPILAFPTPGMPQLVRGAVAYDTSPEYFAKAAARLVDEGARLVGGCCGTTPQHICRLSQELKGKRRDAKPRVSRLREAKEREALAQTDPSELGLKLGHKFVVSVELDVPRGLNLDKLLAGARVLKVQGADVINISDGARARLRMNPSAVAALIQGRVGIEVTMHFSCRDRNLLAIQSDLLGCHAIGVRNILAVTGDPAHIGDYPSATSVFDIDSVGLVRTLSRFNEGIDMAGYSLGIKCGFTIACAYNPLPIDPAFEIDRLKRKVDAGVHVVYTQPVFEPGLAEEAVEVCRKLGVPCLVGVLPLRSQRHTEFMHNEVPGVRIPERLRKQIAEAPDDAAALKIGLAEARSLAAAIRKCAAGLYIMPPFGSAAIAQQVMEGLA